MHGVNINFGFRYDEVPCQNAEWNELWQIGKISAISTEKKVVETSEGVDCATYGKY